MVDLVFSAVAAWLVDREGPPVVVTAVKYPPTASLCQFCKKGTLPQTFLDYVFALLTHYFFKRKCRQYELMNGSIRVF